MDFATLAFYLFAGTAIAAAVATIGSRNPVHAALWLVLTFFTVACTWIIAGAEFLGIALVLVYVGAVMVLFLFVVMMIDVDQAERKEGFVRYLPLGLLVAAAMLVEMLVLLGVFAKGSVAVAAEAEPAVSNTKVLAGEMFTRYLLPFEFAAVILTVAVIAAVMLTLRRREGVRHQNPAEQSRVRPGERLRMVKMPAERPAPAVVQDGEGTP